MTSRVWQFFDAATGHSIGRSFSGSADGLEANTPAGAVAAEVGSAHDARRLDLATLEVLDWQPPAPAADPMLEWTWSEAARSWQSMPSFAARKLARIGSVDAVLTALEAKQQRPLGDILAAMTAGAAPAPVDVARLAELRASVAAGRAARSAMAAATDDAGLNAVAWPS